jgi:Patatin-like phospholipase
MMAGHQKNLISTGEKPFAQRGALPVSAQFQARRFQMPGENSANTPIEWPEVLQSELESFGFPPTAIDLTKPAGQRLDEVHERIRTLQPERSALCISGGGIRSATFALGVVQVLAKAGLLPKFDYLSTVSGGGYLGSMLSAWIHSHPQGLEGVNADLAATCADGPTEPEVAPLSHLRRFSNYLSPKLGLFSADGWTLIATAVRNLLLNWTVFVLILTGLLTVPWLGLLSILALPTSGQLHVLLSVAFVCFVIATAYPGLDLPSLGNFRWRQPWFLFGWMAPLVIGVLCLASWWAGVTNTNRGAAAWLASTNGRWEVVWFLVKFSAVGAVLAMLVVVPRQIASGVFRARATLRHWLNVTGIIVAAVAVVGAPGAALLWWLGAEVFPDPGRHAVAYITFAPVVMLVGFFLLNSLFVGVTSWLSDADDREWWARAAGWVGAVTVAWLTVHCLVFWVPQWIEIFLGPALKASVAASGGILGFIAAKLGASDKAPALREDKPGAKKNLLLTGAAVAFFALLSCSVSLIVDTWIFRAALLPTVLARTEALPNPWLTVLDNRRSFARFGLLLESGATYPAFATGVGLTLLALFGGGFAMGWIVNVNHFSLHATYRNRLVRAYLGAPRTGLRPAGGPARYRPRTPHPFTGFDADDDIRLSDLDHPRPLHVVNMTLNLVTGDELAWQERKAASFTATRLHCGYARGYRPSAEFSGGLRLGTALAISGAAASPNQGYNSSSVVTFLMTLFNVRLGWWLGNPAKPGSRAWTRKGPRHAAFPLFIEALGLTNESRTFVNLSDGGHFENLAIYEMLRRRCRYIVVIDAEYDGSYAFDGLGGIVRKARVDMGIPILFPRRKPEHIKKTRTAPGSYFALGEIDYKKADPAAENGVLLCVKPVLLGGEPADVQHYAKTSNDFPHESTSDQFFSESQFESYRALGSHEMTRVLESLSTSPTTIAGLCTGLNASEIPDA